MIKVLGKKKEIFCLIILIVVVILNINLIFNNRVYNRALNKELEHNIKGVHNEFKSLEWFLKSLKNGYEINKKDILQGAYYCRDIKLEIEKIEKYYEDFKKENLELNEKYSYRILPLL